jgi:hypothetical protein
MFDNRDPDTWGKDKTEMTIKAEIRKELGRDSNVKLFNNPGGVAFQGEPLPSINRSRDNVISLKNPRRMEFGLTKGACDLIGWKTVTITSDMVGKQIAQFIGIEVKTPVGRLQPGQGIFIGNVNEAGGIAGIARSPEEARRLICG